MDGEERSTALPVEHDRSSPSAQADMSGLYEQLWSRCIEPSLILSLEGAVLNTNLAAKRLLEAATWLHAGPARLRAADASEDAALASAIAQAASEGSAAIAMMSSFHRGDGSVVQLYRLQAPAPQTPVLACYVRTFVPPLPEPEHVAKLFGLTPGEARAAVACAREPSVEGAAARLQVKANTVKTLLHRTYHKIGVRNRADLAARLTAAHARLRRAEDLKSG